MKQRFTPALETYEANTAKGLCAYCGRPLDSVTFLLNVEGVQYRLHEPCRKALLVAERLKPSPAPISYSVTASSVVTPLDRGLKSDQDIFERYFKNKMRQAP